MPKENLLSSNHNAYIEVTMIRQFCLSTIIFCICTPAALSKSNNISVNPLGLLFGTVSLGYEHKLSNTTSLGVFGSYADLKISDFRFTVYSLGLRSNFALSSNDILADGWYVAPLVQYSSIEWTFKSDEDGKVNEPTTTMSLAAIFGYGWFWGSGFNIRLGLGPQLSRITFGKIEVENEDGTKETPERDRSFSGVSLTGEFTMGIAF
jgi:hypothetical protein